MNSESNRDSRMDLLRGIGLLCIYSNHIGDMTGNTFLTFFSWRQLGVSDAAELFIFISGYLFGIVYTKTLLTEGFMACQRKAMRRSLQIYCANAITLGVILGLVHIFDFTHGSLFQMSGLKPFFVHPGEAMKGFLLVDDVPAIFDVLFLYVFFLLIMPSLLYLFYRNHFAGISVSLLMYALSFNSSLFKVFDHLQIWSLAINPLALNPFAWQLLFFIGMTMGMRIRTGAPMAKPTVGTGLICAGILLAIFSMKMNHHFIRSNLFGLGRYSKFLPYILPLSEKERLEPLRIVHFFALACVFRLILPATSSLLETRPARLIIKCGQHSLPIFCLGLVLSYLVCFILTAAHLPLPVQVLILASGWALMLLSGTMLSSLKLKKRAMAKPWEWVKAPNPRKFAYPSYSEALKAGGKPSAAPLPIALPVLPA